GYVRSPSFNDNDAFGDGRIDGKKGVDSFKRNQNEQPDGEQKNEPSAPRGDETRAATEQPVENFILRLALGLLDLHVWTLLCPTSRMKSKPNQPLGPAHHIQGQASWRVASEEVEAFVTKVGGHLGPVTFKCGDRRIRPYSVAPWGAEAVDTKLPAIIKVL